MSLGKKVVVCGTREWSAAGRMLPKIVARLKALPYCELIHGDCDGVDRICAALWSMGPDFLLAVPADWNSLGLKAGPIRNRKMLDMKPDLVIAFHPDIEHSKGTKDIVNEARRRGITVELIT